MPWRSLTIQQAGRRAVAAADRSSLRMLIGACLCVCALSQSLFQAFANRPGRLVARQQALAGRSQLPCCLLERLRHDRIDAQCHIIGVAGLPSVQCTGAAQRSARSDARLAPSRLSRMISSCAASRQSSYSSKIYVQRDTACHSKTATPSKTPANPGAVLQQMWRRW